MTSSSQSSTVTPAPQDSAWPPAHISETMSAADRASWLGQVQRDRARRLEMDVAEIDLRRRRPHGDLRNDEDNQEETLEPPPEVKPLIDMFPGVSAALLTRVFERKLKATELIRFKEKQRCRQIRLTIRYINQINQFNSDMEFNQIKQIRFESLNI
ncbi:hypothetical protein B0T10DRAFT_611066 [Thelonectria olida]|uniref:Uncharacterized protein n=1 Tax=Thelonectria olida TaxID=1576542 RepID=A0A9P9AHX1_9HYPO|nr:hypothetical protein B0T10DRAFT_611066 [Thelonectria olida]